jgi:hypothetical protein
MVLDYNKVLFSESSLRKLMPKHIKKRERGTSKCAAAKPALSSRICNCVRMGAGGGGLAPKAGLIVINFLVISPLKNDWSKWCYNLPPR